MLQRIRLFIFFVAAPLRHATVANTLPWALLFLYSALIFYFCLLSAINLLNSEERYEKCHLHMINYHDIDLHIQFINEPEFVTGN